MPERERQPHIPQWAERERIGDLAWIGGNLQSLWSAARTAFEANGRGAMVVDTTIRPTGAGHPFGYFSQDQIRQFGGNDEIRMVTVYDPSWELVVVLLKSQDRISSYRVGVPRQQSKSNIR